MADSEVAHVMAPMQYVEIARSNSAAPDGPLFGQRRDQRADFAGLPDEAVEVRRSNKVIEDRAGDNLQAPLNERSGNLRQITLQSNFKFAESHILRLIKYLLPSGKMGLLTPSTPQQHGAVVMVIGLRISYLP